MNKKNIFLWTFYDFANSIVLIVFFLYFSQWLVVDKGVSDFWYNMIFAIGSLLLVLTTPIWGGIADKNGKQLSYLNFTTIATFVSYLLLSVVALFFSNNILLAILFFALANYFYQFSFVFYNALLPYLGPKEKWGQISGIGQAGNWLGEIAGILLTLPFAGGVIFLFGESGRAQTFLPATLIFMLFALPMILFFRLPKKEYTGGKIRIWDEYAHFWQQFKELVKAPGMGLFLLSYFFFNDAILTASNNFPIYMESVFGVSDNTKSMILLGILITSAIGAYLSGYISDRIGLKKALMIVLGSWVILFPLFGITTNLTFFIILCVLMGFLFGSVWTVTRAAMAVLCPKDKLNFGFGFYTMAERVSTFIGPLAWGTITVLLSDMGPNRYRITVASMAIFVAAGIYLLGKVEIQEN